MMTYGTVDVLIHVFLTSALVIAEWPDSLPGRFTPGKRVSGNQWIEDLFGPEPVWTLWRIENYSRRYCDLTCCDMKPESRNIGAREALFLQSNE
jgi:hypothetical protein